MTRGQTTTTTHEQHMEIPVPQVEPRRTIPFQNLRIPGPTPVPPAVLAELSRPLINHRGPEFAAILRRVTARLQYIFQTTSPVLTFPASGTGGQECALVNLFSPGEHVVAITIGHFGNRFAQIAERYGLQVSRIAFPWGEAADPAIVEDTSARTGALPWCAADAQRDLNGGDQRYQDTGGA